MKKLLAVGVLVVFIIAIVMAMGCLKNKEKEEIKGKSYQYSCFLYVTDINHTDMGQLIEGVCLNEEEGLEGLFKCNFHFTHQKLEKLQVEFRIGDKLRLFYGKDEYGGTTIQKVGDYP